jgi:outer membrane protein TolC
MYTELLPVDLPTVVQVAIAQNFDIKLARSAVEASLGEYESAVGGAFPAIVPTAAFEHVEGTVRATEGNLVGVGFDTFQAGAAIQWIVNPGQVYYDIVAAKKRLFATERQEQSVVQETLRRAVVQYYQLALAQARVSAEHQGVTEAEELLRISRIRVQTGTGVLADELRAEARLAERQQDLVTAVNLFYIASVSLSVTLHLDSVVTLLPNADELPPTTLVRSDLPIDELLGIAVVFRPDLESVRQTAQAVAAKTGSTWWSGFGPELALGYRYGGIMGNAHNVEGGDGIPSNLMVHPGSPNGSFASNPLANGLIKEGILRGSHKLNGRESQSYGFHDQQRGTAGVGWRISLSAFGDLKTATAVEKQAMVRAEQMLDQARAQVVTSAQSSDSQDKLVTLARQQVTSAEEALRLSEANLRAGTMTTLDVLQAQDAATQARLRYAQAVVSYNQSQVNLLAALGLLSEDAILLNAEG